MYKENQLKDTRYKIPAKGPASTRLSEAGEARQRRQDTSGLTLVEITLVVGILVILSAVVLVTLNVRGNAGKSRNVARISDLENIQKALDFRAQDTGTPLPTDIPAHSTCIGSGQSSNNYGKGIEIDPLSSYGSGLAGLWHLNNSAGTISGTTVDATTNGNTGTLNNFQLPNGFVSSGWFSNALSFDGIDDRVQVNDAASLDLSTNITLAAWFNTKGSTNDQVIIDKSGGSATTTNYRLTITPANKVRFEYYNNAIGTWEAYDGTPTIIHNYWYHVAVFYTSGNGLSIKMYINGLPVTGAWRAGDTGNIALVPNNDPLWIGTAKNDANTGFAYPFKGSIDEAAVWNRLLTEPEIQTLALGGNCYNLGQYLTPNYLGSMPKDPKTGTDANTQYLISVDSSTNVVCVNAPSAELNETIQNCRK